MQLDALLRSVERVNVFESVSVLYVASNEGHAAAYDACPRYGATWFAQNEFADFERMVRWWVAGHDRISFATDDEIYFRQPPASMLRLQDPDTVVTLRQGRNTTYCHPLDCEQRVPDVFPWRWQEAEHDFGYPLSLNACIYRSADLLPLLNFPFTNPTQLEAGLACQAANFGPQQMTAPEHSCTVALPHNVVSSDSGCPRGANPEWQPDALCERFLDGWRIDIAAMDWTDIRAAHQEVPLKFWRP